MQKNRQHADKVWTLLEQGYKNSLPRQLSMIDIQVQFVAQQNS
ncbi:Uncharacterised protein [Bacteroides xylanisolvens]|nr:Uncharacterised protein [Bacteroides xylanisolvens]